MRAREQERGLKWRLLFLDLPKKAATRSTSCFRVDSLSISNLTRLSWNTSTVFSIRLNMGASDIHIKSDITPPSVFERTVPRPGRSSSKEQVEEIGAPQWCQATSGPAGT